MESQLRFSRSNEQEADRHGMKTMVAAGMDPHAAPTMFERMLHSSRYSRGNSMPEFLRTHPLSENRIADTRNRARQHPKVVREVSLPFQLVRARIKLHHAESPQRAAAEFKDILAQGKPRSPEATRYGLVLAQIESSQPASAKQNLDILQSRNPGQLEYVLASADLDIAISEAQAAVRILEGELKLYPGNQALTMAYARALVQDDKPHIAEEVLMEQVKLRPNDPALWYQLAEVHGLSGNIVGLHQARAEYFILNGVFDEAERQLNYALRLSRDNYHTAAKVNQRIRDIGVMRQKMKL